MNIRCAVLTLPLGLLVACQESPTELTGGHNLAAATATSESSIRALRLEQFGCAVVWPENGQNQTRLISRQALPQAIRSSGRSRTPDGTTVVSNVATEVKTDVLGKRVNVGVACVLDRGMEPSVLRAVLEGSGSTAFWKEVGSVAGQAVSSSPLPLRLQASMKLTTALTAGMTKRRKAATPQGAMLWSVPAGIRVPTQNQAIGGIERVDSWLSRLSSYYVPVTIWNSGTTIYIDNNMLMYMLERLVAWNGEITIDDFTDCAVESARWFSMDAERISLEKDSAAMDNAYYNVANFNCERQTTGESKCIDFFIRSARAGIFYGDGREEDPNALYSASRLQVYLDLDNNIGRFYVNHSNSILLPWIAEADTSLHWAKVVVLDANTKVLQVRASNNYCYGWMPNFVCPAIDANIRFVKQAGSWVIDGNNGVRRDAFPTMVVYDDSPGGWIKRYESPENKWTDLYTKRSTLQGWRREMGLPPGCFFE